MFDNGAEPVAVNYQLPSPQTLCDNQWHTVSLEKNLITGTLSLDGDMVASVESRAVSFVSLDTDSPLFVGGVPSEFTQTTLRLQIFKWTNMFSLLL